MGGRSGRGTLVDRLQRGGRKGDRAGKGEDELHEGDDAGRRRMYSTVGEQSKEGWYEQKRQGGDDEERMKEEGAAPSSTAPRRRPTQITTHTYTGRESKGTVSY